jgi:hypothetical protein
MKDRRLLIVGIVLIVIGIVGLVILGSMWQQWPWMHGNGGMMVPLTTL